LLFQVNFLYPCYVGSHSPAKLIVKFTGYCKPKGSFVAFFMVGPDSCALVVSFKVWTAFCLWRK